MFNFTIAFIIHLVLVIDTFQDRSPPLICSECLLLILAFQSPPILVPYQCTVLLELDALYLSLIFNIAF